jgi:hypothetical protein
MRHRLTATSIGLCVGLVAPLIWLVAWRNGHNVSDDSGILDRLTPFFPFSIINLAAPHPPDRFWATVVFAMSAFLNAVLYGLIVTIAYGVLGVARNWQRSRAARSVRR